MIDAIIRFLDSLLGWSKIDELEHIPLPSLDNQTEVVLEPPQEPTEPPKDMLATFCIAIRDYEGVPGDLNYRNNNPGNFRCSPVGYAAMYGNVKCVNGFAVFPTYELGWMYLNNIVKERVSKHPEWNFYNFFYDYAPPADDNHPSNYAVFVAKRCGTVPRTLLRSVLA